MTTVDLNDKSTFYATSELIDDLKAKNPEGLILNFAYTDYGGTYWDKVVIDYFIEKYPDSIVWENAAYSGKNLFLFGEVAKRFLEETENYALGFEGMEEYYTNKEHEQCREDFQRFLNDIETYKGYTIKENALEFLMEQKAGDMHMTTQGADYSEAVLIAYCAEHNLIEKQPDLETDL